MIDKQLIIDYKTTFNSEAGQRVLKDLEKVCGFNATRLCVGHNDLQSFHLGQRDIFIYIKSNLDMNIERPVPKEAESENLDE